MAIQATSEEQLRLRRRARRRLLGAVTLLLMAAIFLPMLLDQEPRSLDRDIEIRIPAQTAPPPPVISTAPSAIQRPAVSAEEPAPPSIATNREDEAPATPDQAPLAEPDTRSRATAPKPEKAPLKTGSSQKSDPAALEKSARASHFVVQLGAFSSAKNVRQLRERLSAAGIQTYTESLPNGTTRVRAGPFKTRKQADATQASIALTGVQANVIVMDD